MKATVKIAESIENGMQSSQREASISALTTVLCDQHVLYVKTRNFHWNLKGPRFHTLHELFEEHYKALEKAIDETAERIRMLGGVSPGSMAEFIDGANLKEAASEIIDGEAAISTLISDHDAVVRSLRETIALVEEENEDFGSADFLTATLQEHEQAAWMLRSLQG